MIYITSATSGMLDSTIFQADGASVEVEPKTITANGTYTAPEGVAYSPVTVNVPTGITPTGNIQLTAQSGTDVTNYATASVRGASLSLSTPTVNTSGLITSTASLSTSGWIGSAPTSQTHQLSSADDADFVAGNIKNGVTIFGITGTYTGGGGSSTIKQGTLTISSDVKTATSTKITDTTELGFTPKAFMLMRSAASATRYHLQQTTFTTVGDTYYRTLTYRSSSAYTTSNSATNWTSQTAGYLYFNSNTVYYRSSTSYYLEAGTYYWMAMTW